MVARLDAAPLCLITLSYAASLDAVDAHMSAHVAWLNQGFDNGLFLIAGRQVPRVGGMILSRGRRAEVEALAATDPFITSGVATFTVTEVAASMATDSLAALLE